VLTIGLKISSPISDNGPMIPSSSSDSRQELEIIVSLASAELRLAELVSLRPGSTLRFPQRVDEPLELVVDERRVGSARAVSCDGRLGVRLESASLESASLESRGG